MRNLRIQFWPPLEQELIGRSFCRHHRLRTLRPKLKRRQRWRLNTPLSVSRTRSNFAVIRKLKRDRWSRLRRLHVETETRARPILRPSLPAQVHDILNRNLLLRASILINSSYVALCLNNPILALDFSERLLEFNKNCILVSLLFALLHLLVTRQLFSWRKWVIPIIASIVKQIGKLTICCLILLFIKTTTDQFGQTCFLFAILQF